MSNILIENIKKSGIEFRNDKNGNRIAWYFSFKAMRKFRLKLLDAEMLVASGRVEEVNDLF